MVTFLDKLVMKTENGKSFLTSYWWNKKQEIGWEFTDKTENGKTNCFTSYWWAQKMGSVAKGNGKILVFVSVFSYFSVFWGILKLLFLINVCFKIISE